MKLVYTPPRAIEQWVLRVVKSSNPSKDPSLNVRSSKSFNDRGTHFTNYGQYRQHHPDQSYLCHKYDPEHNSEVFHTPSTRPSPVIHGHGEWLYHHNSLLARYHGSKLFWVNYDNGSTYSSGYKHTLLRIIDGTGYGRNALVFVDADLMKKDPRKCPGAFFKMFDERMDSLLGPAWDDYDAGGPDVYLEGILHERNLFARTYGLTAPPLLDHIAERMVLNKLAA